MLIGSSVASAFFYFLPDASDILKTMMNDVESSSEASAESDDEANEALRGAPKIRRQNSLLRTK